MTPLLRHYVAATVLGLSVLLAGCDAVVPVTGTVTTTAEAPLKDCEAVLYLAEDQRELDRTPISGRFREAFTVYPVKTNFYVEVTCEGYSTFRSKPIFSSGQMDDLTDLGKIQLEPQEVESAPARP